MKDLISQSGAYGIISGIELNNFHTFFNTLILQWKMRKIFRLGEIKKENSFQGSERHLEWPQRWYIEENFNFIEENFNF